MSVKTIVILGGGVGGIVSANELRTLLPSQHNVVLVEKKTQHAFAPSFLWLMTGDRKLDKITKPVRKLVHPGVEIIHDEVTDIQIENRSIITNEQSVGFDYLIIALGAELSPELIPGLKEEAFSFFTFEETVKLQQALTQFNSGNVAVVVSAVPYKCPGAPHEAAMLIADYYRKRGLKDNVNVHLYTPEPQPMPVAGPQLGDAVIQMLKSKGITFNPFHKLNSVDPQNNTLLFDGKGPIRYDLLIAIPPHRAPGVVRESGLTNESGWIPVERTTLKTKYENIYAIGDIITIDIPGRWKPDIPMKLPKAGVFAHKQAEVVAHNIPDEIKGVEPERKFPGVGYCMLEAGGHLAGFAYGDFFAEPSPRLELRIMGKRWHYGKILFEKWWLSSFGFIKSILRFIINIGSRVMKVPAQV